MASSSRGVVLRQIGRLFEGGTVAGLADSQLLDRFVGRRDEQAFAALVERHGPMVLGVCRAILKNAAEVEDAFQATFLVLIRKAGSVRGDNALGAWLHRVAYRIAVQAAADIARRRMLEQRAGELAAMQTDTAELPEELRAILHEEIDRLPENLRLALVLCDLDGLGRDDAARQLGWTEGELRGRLARARSKLRERLTRRGFAVSAGLLVDALARESSAAVPRIWVEAIARAAVAMPAGKTVASGVISETAARLARATLATLAAAQAKGVATVGILLVALGLIGSHTIPVGFAQTGDGDAMKREMPAPKQAAPPTKPFPVKADDRTKTITFAGQVLDPDGKPFAGAKFYVPAYGLKDNSSRIRAASGSDGRFRFDVPIEEFDRTFEAEPWRHAPVVARVEGFAFGLANRVKEGDALTLRLARDLPIEGRIIDIQGKPVPGVSIRVKSIRGAEEEDLTAWLKAVAEKGALYVTGVSELLTRHLSFQPDPPLITPVRSDADGRFRIAGIGRERLAELQIEGPTIETVRVMVRIRPGEALRFPPWNGSDRITIYGSSFVHVAGPTRPIQGIVRDVDTGQPLADITIMGERPFSAGISEFVSARTDRQGHYRLVGLPRGREGNVVAVSPADLPFFGRSKAEKNYPPDESLPYVQAQFAVPKRDDKETITLDMGLKRGAYVTGRVLDKATGKPVEAQVEYYVPLGNPARKQFNGSRRLSHHHQFHPTDRSGTFHLMAYPGPGILATRARDDRYVFSVGIEALAKWKDKENYIACEPNSLYVGNHHTLIEIDPADGTDTISKDVFVDPGRAVTVDLVGPDGKLVAGDMVAGLKGMVYWEKQADSLSSLHVEGLVPGKAREVAARNDAIRLVGSLLLEGDETSPVRMSLEPWGEIDGRLIDADGQPWQKGVKIINLQSDSRRAQAPCPELESDGRFRIVGLIPGRSYNFLIVDEKTHFIKGRIIADVMLRPGEVKEVGDVTPKPWMPK